MVELTSNVSLNGQSIDITVYEDIDDTGTVNNQQTVSVDDGTNTYDLNDLEGGAGNAYWPEFDLSTNDTESSPIVHSLELVVQTTIPITIDGDDVTEITIDGNDVQEITMDGDVVWELDAIPDTVTEQSHAWFDASQLDLSHGDGITEWADESGNGHNLTGGAPEYQSDVQNGEPAAYFDGTDELDVEWPDLSQPVELFVVASLSTADRYALYCNLHGTTDRVHYSARPDYDTGGWMNYAGEVLQGGAVTDDWQIHNPLHNGTDSVVRINDTVETTGNAGTRGMDGLIMGARDDGDHLVGWIGELIVFDKELTESERTDVYDYLHDKWLV